MMLYVILRDQSHMEDLNTRYINKLSNDEIIARLDGQQKIYLKKNNHRCQCIFLEILSLNN